MFVSRYEDKRKAILFAPAKVLKLPPAGKQKKKTKKHSLQFMASL